MLRAARNLGRLVGIARNLARHDALFPLEALPLAPAARAVVAILARGRVPNIAAKRPGERLALGLQTLGPSFIKLGQALSVRSDLMVEDIAADLSALQDRLPPFDGATARATVEAELGVPIDSLFQSFDDLPVAAASIAQVHFAVIAEGADVAVKVLRPGIEAAFARDIELFSWLAQLAERHRPDLRRLKPVEVVAMFQRTVDLEMDMRFEAAAAEELAHNFADDTTFRVPRVDWTRTAQRVLTLERVAGIPIDEREALLAAGHDLEEIVRRMAVVLFKQVFRDGFFHADLHPGNLFVDADGTINAVDFGIMGRLDKRTRLYLAEMLVGFLTGDYLRVAEIHLRAGYIPAGQSVEAFAQACRSIAEPILGRPLAEISLARLLAQLFRITARFRMETQPQLLLLQKTLLVAEGVCRKLYPEVNMWDMARPLIEDWVKESLNPEARVLDTLAEMRQGLERLPAVLAGMEQSVGTLAQGGLKLHPESVSALIAAQGAEHRGGHWPLWLALGAAILAAVLL